MDATKHDFLLSMKFILVDILELQNMVLRKSEEEDGRERERNN